MLPRSYLFVPGDRPERFDKALASGADAVVLDLEDAVAPARKALAREAVAAWWQACPAAGRARIVLRVNALTEAAAADDLNLLATLQVRTAMLAKTETAAQVAALRETVPGCAVLALIESARGVTAALEIAAADGVQRLVFGTLDFALDLDIPPAPAGLAHAAGCLVLASRATGLPAPVAGVTPEIGDAARLLADWAWARSLGFGAKLCIHPNQIAPIHDALRPSEAERAWAERVVAAAATARGAAVQVDGRMVDAPVLRRAERLLAHTTR